MKLASFSRGLKAAIGIHVKDRFRLTGDAHRTLAFWIDFSICAGIAIAVAFVSDSPLVLLLFLVLLSTRSLLFSNRSIGMVITGTHLVSEDGTTKASWWRVLLRDSLMPFLVALSFALYFLGGAISLQWPVVVYAFLKTASAFMILPMIRLHKGSSLENGISEIDRISKTRLRKMPGK